MSSTNIQIAVKVRPLIERELKEKTETTWIVKENSVLQVDYAQNCYSFDHIFDENKTNKDVYDSVVFPLVSSCLQGINSTIFAYGQTSSGKTHTMLGDNRNPGIITYAIEDIFKQVEENSSKKFLLRCSYLEIYNEKINDLLDAQKKDIKIREDFNQGVHVAVREEVIRKKDELFALMKKGMKIRKIGCTDMNERSSRSHTIFKLIIQSQDIDSEGSYTESFLSLVDLAGSERVGQMNLKGERQAEGVLINKSLTTLGLVIRRLSENEQFINYRDSKLTRLLQHSLGGNSKTLIICTITLAALDETKSTLEFAQRAKYVKNQPIINEKVTDKDQIKQYARMCQDYKEQIERKEITINALKDKIHGIELFSLNSNIDFKLSKTHHRRHTMGHYKPSLKNKLFIPQETYSIEENSDEDVFAEQTTRKSVKLTCDISEDNNTQQIDMQPTTPSKTLRFQKELLEQSYESLKSYTNYEKKFLGQNNELKELKALVERLTNENISLNQHIIKEREYKINTMEVNRDVYDNLIFLKAVLEGDSSKGKPRKSLHTIVEEDQTEMLTTSKDEVEVGEWLKEILDNQTPEEESEKTNIAYNIDINKPLIENSVLINENLTLLEEIDKLKYQLEERTNKVLELDDKIHLLEKDLIEKDSLMTNLKLTIKKEQDTKEAELDILNNKLQKLSSYKEEMHNKLSELQQLNESLNKQDKFDSVVAKYSALEKKITNLQIENDKLEQQAIHYSQKISELESEIETNKIDKLATQELEMQLDDLKEKARKFEEAQREITDLRQVVKTEAQTATSFEDELIELKIKYSQMVNERSYIEEQHLKLEQEVENFKTENITLQTKLDIINANKSMEDELKVQNKIYQSKIADLQKDNDEMKETISSSTRNLHEQEILNLELQKKVSDFLSDISSLKEDSMELKTLKKSYSEKTVECDNLVKSLENILTEKIKIQEQCDLLKSENTTLSNDILEAKLSNDSRTKEIDTLNEELNEYKKASMGFENMEFNYKKELSNLQNELVAVQSTYEQKLLDLNSRLKILTEENLKSKNSLTSAIFDCNSYEEKTKTLLSQISELNSQIHNQQNTQSTLEIIQQDSMQMQQLNKDLEAVKIHLSEENKKLEEYIQTKDAELNILQRNNIEIQELCKNLELAKDQWTTDNKKLEECILLKNNELNILQKDYTEIQELNKNLEHAKDQLTAENKKLKECILLKNNELAILQKDYAEIQELNINLELAKDQLTTDNKKLEECILLKNNELNVPQKDYTEILELNKNLELAKDQLTAENKKLEECIPLKNNELNILQKDYTEIQELNKKLELAKNQLTADNKKLEEDILLKNNELNILQKDYTEIQDLNKNLELAKDQLTAENKKLEECILLKNNELNILQKDYTEIQELNKNLEIAKKHLTTDIEKLEECILLKNTEHEELKKLINSTNRNDEQDTSDCSSSRIIMLQKENSELKDSLALVTSDLNKESILNLGLRGEMSEFQVELTILKNRNRDLESNQQKIEHILIENDSLTKSLQSLTAQKESIQQLNKDLEEDRNQTLKKFKDLDNMLQKNILELQDLRKKHSMSVQELTAFKKQYYSMNEQYEQKEIELTSALSLVNSLKTSNDHMQIQLSELTEKINIIDNENSELKTILASSKEDSIKLEKTNKQLKDEIRKLSENILKLDEKVQLETSKHSSLEVETKKLKETIELYQQELKEKENEISTLYEDITVINSECQRLKVANGELKTNVLLTDEERDSLRKTIRLKDEQIDMLNKEVLKLTDESIAKETVYLSKLKNENTKLEEIILQNKNAQMETLHLRGEIEKLTAEFNNTVKEMDKTITSLKEDLTSMSTAYNNEQKLNLKLKKEISNHLAEISILKCKYEETNSFKNKIVSMEAEIKKLENTLEIKNKENKSLLCTIENNQKKLEQKMDVSEDLQTELQEKHNGSNDGLKINNSENILKEKHVTRLSDEGKQLSPNELRRIKRQSIHDQCRGLKFSLVDNSETDSVFSDELTPVKKQTQNNQLASLKNESLPDMQESSCSSCNTLRLKLDKINEEKDAVDNEIKMLKERNTFLDGENEEMLNMLRVHEQELSETYQKLHNLSDINIEKSQLEHKINEMRQQQNRIVEENLAMKSALARRDTEINSLRKERDMLESKNTERASLESTIEKLNEALEEKENLYKNLKAQFDRKANKAMDETGTKLDHILKERSVTHFSDEGNLYDSAEIRKIKRQYVHDERRGLQFSSKDTPNFHRTELESKLSNGEKLIMEYKEKIADLESDILLIQHKHDETVRKLKQKISDLQNMSRKPVYKMVDKETQATCDMHKKYQSVKKIAIWRKKEGDYLRTQLNLPLNCPVLPDDVENATKEPES
ncbi:kinesin-related protein 4-like isoform X2 [Sitophilus oryzae]|uniref:Kinesin-related protein 4-like isoform X2 n=1 Tax=Sitophilus oryzae TaxID=7048 RepID=A0A6J2X8Q6_SITOR|nr:kinesin-related protein 4-like isoform X2 [Sitophilus oryzae]